MGRPGWGMGREDGHSGWAGVGGDWPGPAPPGTEGFKLHLVAELAQGCWDGSGEVGVAGGGLNTI